MLEDRPGNFRENKGTTIIKHEFAHRNTLLGNSCNNRINIFVELKLSAFSWEFPGENRLSLTGNSLRKKLDKICGFEQVRANERHRAVQDTACSRLVALHSIPGTQKAGNGY